jgi:hypothetical protein
MTSRKTFQAQHDHPPSCKPFCGMSWRRWIACWNQVRGEGHKPQQNSVVYLLLQWGTKGGWESLTCAGSPIGLSAAEIEGNQLRLYFSATR